jgi:hypothetical protein
MQVKSYRPYVSSAIGQSWKRGSRDDHGHRHLEVKCQSMVVGFLCLYEGRKGSSEV